MGRARGASSLWQAGRGGEAPETKGTSAAAAGRAGRGCPRKSAPEASSGAPAPELLTFGATSFLFCEEPQRFCFHHFALHLRAETTLQGNDNRFSRFCPEAPSSLSKKFLDLSSESCFKSHTKTIAVHNTPLIAHWCTRCPVTSFDNKF